jgi:hypothetical protein
MTRRYFTRISQVCHWMIQSCIATTMIFLRLIAREYYRAAGEAMEREDRKHLVFGDRYLLADMPTEVLEEALPWIDAIAVQPYEPRFEKSRFNRVYRIARKPILICDDAFSFPAIRNPAGQSARARRTPRVRTRNTSGKPSLSPTSSAITAATTWTVSQKAREFSCKVWYARIRPRIQFSSRACVAPTVRCSKPLSEETEKSNNLPIFNEPRAFARMRLVQRRLGSPAVARQKP